MGIATPDDHQPPKWFPNESLTAAATATTPPPTEPGSSRPPVVTSACFTSRSAALSPSAVTAAPSSLAFPLSDPASTPRSPSPRRPSSAPTVVPDAVAASVTALSVPSSSRSRRSSRRCSRSRARRRNKCNFSSWLFLRGKGKELWGLGSLLWCSLGQKGLHDTSGWGQNGWPSAVFRTATFLLVV